MTVQVVFTRSHAIGPCAVDDGQQAVCFGYLLGGHALPFGTNSVVALAGT